MKPEELTAVQQAQYKEVAEELRCLVCQNQSIADSQSGLAADLKSIIVQQLQAGKNKEEIKVFMQERYGEFIVYKPAFNPANAVLWLGPWLLLLILLIGLARRWKKSVRLASVSTAQEPDALSGKVSSVQPHWAEQLYQDEKPK